MESKKGLCILGATGSIGSSTLAVVSQHPELFEVIALSAATSVDALFKLCCLFQPRFAVMTDKDAAKVLKARIQTEGLKTIVYSGVQALCEVVALPEVQKVVAGIVGAAGLLPTLSAAKAGKEIVFANKEALVMAGDLLIQTARKNGAVLLPVDSEHNALFQCMPAGFVSGTRPQGVKKLILTASGGAFLHTPIAELKQVTPEMACCHPNWKMGKKITVDCASLMNKGLEVIEAYHLFQFEAEDIDVVIHPQSIIHSLVEYTDGSVLAQMGTPDMRVPLSYCLAWPQRIPSGAQRLSLTEIGQLTFLEPDKTKFRCLALAYEAIRLGKAAPAVLNASNEVVVEAFLNRLLSFDRIPSIVEAVLQKYNDVCAESLDDIICADNLARAEAMRLI